MLCPHNNEDCDNPGCRHGGCQGRKPAVVADTEFGWVPEWLNDPAPPTPAIIRGAELLRKLRTPALALLCMIGTAWGEELPPTQAMISSCLVPGCDATSFIVKAIDDAQTEIRGQAYNFTSQPIVDALIRAHQRGVDVAFLLDKISPCQKGAGAGALADAGIPVKIDKLPRIAHNKVLVIDGDRVIEGSFNFSAAAMHNAEDTNLVVAAEVAQHYKTYWIEREKVSIPYAKQADWCKIKT